MRELDAPDQSDGGPERHHDVDEQGHPRGRGMDIKDAETVTLLVVGGRTYQAPVRALEDDYQRGPTEPWREPLEDAKGMRRRAELVYPGPHCVAVVPYPKASALHSYPYRSPQGERTEAACQKEQRGERLQPPGRRSPSKRLITGPSTEGQERHREGQHQKG